MNKDMIKTLRALIREELKNMGKPEVKKHDLRFALTNTSRPAQNEILLFLKANPDGVRASQVASFRSHVSYVANFLCLQRMEKSGTAWYDQNNNLWYAV